MSKILKLIPFIIILSIAACSTPYQSANDPSWFAGGYGYSDQPAPGGMTKITYTGNGNTAANLVNKYAVFRAAQLAKQKNKPYFAMYDSLGAAVANKKTQMPSMYNSLGSRVSYIYVSYHNRKQPGDLSVKQTYAKYSSQFLKPNRRG